METLPNFRVLAALVAVSWFAVYGACSLVVDVWRAM